MEACGSAHHWARKLAELGHTVKLMAPQFVKPYVKTNKNDAADAEAICEAVGRPNMRFVPVKSAEQQGVLRCTALVRASLRRAPRRRIRSAACSRNLASSSRKGSRRSPSGCRRSSRMARTDCPADFGNCSSGSANSCENWIGRWASWKREIQLWHRDNEASRKLAQIPGIGPITASALVASMGTRRTSRMDGSSRHGWDWFRDSTRAEANRRCWESASAASCYLRTLLIHGARAVIRYLPRACTNRTAGSSVYWADATRTWQQWHWPTRMRALPGRCWPTIESSGPIMCRRPQRVMRPALRN